MQLRSKERPLTSSSAEGIYKSQGKNLLILSQLVMARVGVCVCVKRQLFSFRQLTLSTICIYILCTSDDHISFLVCHETSGLISTPLHFYFYFILFYFFFFPSFGRCCCLSSSLFTFFSKDGKERRLVTKRGVWWAPFFFNSSFVSFSFLSDQTLRDTPSG